MERNIIERAVKTEIDTRTLNEKEWARSVGLCRTLTVTSPTRQGEPAGMYILGNTVAEGDDEK